MPQEIQYTNDVTLSLQKVQGSDGRLNVSSRADTRAYYNSRDLGQTYSFTWRMTNANDTETVAYLRNDSTTGKILVVDAIGLNSDVNTQFKLSFVTGTASAGTAVTPTNLNKASGNAATATAQQPASDDAPITGLTTDGEIDFAYCVANGHEEFRLGDRVRLAQNDAVEIEVFVGTNADVGGVIFFFLE